MAVPKSEFVSSSFMVDDRSALDDARATRGSSVRRCSKLHPLEPRCLDPSKNAILRDPRGAFAMTMMTADIASEVLGLFASLDGL